MNNDGNITKEELEKFDVDKTHKWKDILVKLDLDGDGQFNYQEFLAAAIDKDKLMSDENIKIAFDLFDTDGSGTIDVNEFYHLITDCDGDKKVEHTKHYHEGECKDSHDQHDHISD